MSLTSWKHPRDYGGFSPDGDLCLYANTRDSGALDRSNWRRICEDLKAEPYDDGDDGFESRPAVYHWRAGHWACGWIEYLMIRADAPATTLDQAREIDAKLAAYPVYDDDHFSELEYNEACEYWASMSVQYRVDAIHCSHSDACIFAARRADMPNDSNGALFDYLRSD